MFWYGDFFFKTAGVTFVFRRSTIALIALSYEMIEVCLLVVRLSMSLQSIMLLYFACLQSFDIICSIVNR